MRPNFAVWWPQRGIAVEDNMIPTGLDVDETPTPTDCMEECVHAEACRAQLARLRGYDVDEDAAYWMDTLAIDLGCGEDCDCYDEDDTADLRRVVKQLIETVKVGESMCECELMAHRFKSDLRMLGFEV